MDRVSDILALVLFGLVASVLYFSIKSEKKRLHEVVGILGGREASMVDSLESLVKNGKLVPSKLG